MALVSVIIPVYNLEKYLKQCLESVVSQTLKDIEILCVNDGSTDSSLEILEEYASRDTRIRIINQENHGAGNARNTGLNIAAGEYLYFLDGDDYIENKTLELLVEKIVQVNADICICEHQFLDERTNSIILPEETLLQIELFDKNDCISSQTNPENIFKVCIPQLALKLYRASFIRKYQLEFQELTTCNDTYFHLCSLALASSITYINEILLTYRVNRKNALSINRNKSTICIFQAFEKVKEKLMQENIFTQVEESFYNYARHSFGFEIKLCHSHEKKIFLAKAKSFLPAKQYREVFKMQNKMTKVQKIFSIRNKDKYKILTILGISIKFKRKSFPSIKHIDKKQVTKQLKHCGYGLSKETRNPEIIVSLTSFPQRMYDMHFGLYSLFNQSVKPNKIILWLAEEEFPNKEKDLPCTVLFFLEKGLEIKWCSNIKSYKKLIPSLKAFPNAIIVTADDDIYYPEDWLEKLCQSYQKNPQCIHCHRAHKIRLDSNKKILPYAMWEHEIRNSLPAYINFFTGCGGVLFPPKSLYADILNEALFTKLAPNADDIWFWAMAVLQKTKIVVAEDNIKQLTYINPERELGLNGEITLFSQNGSQGQNDVQLRNVLAHYPQIMERIINE